MVTGFVKGSKDKAKCAFKSCFKVITKLTPTYKITLKSSSINQCIIKTTFFKMTQKQKRVRGIKIQFLRNDLRVYSPLGKQED